MDDAVLKLYLNLHIAATALHEDCRATFRCTVGNDAVAHFVANHRTVAANLVL